MTTSPPPGFEELPPQSAHMEVFGSVYLNKDDARLGFFVGRHHTNQLGICHGGVIATFADMQVAAVNASGQRAAQGFTPTVSLTIDYVASAKLGDWVELSSMLLRETKALLFTQALLTVEGGIIARASAVYRIYQPRG